ncbi:MAG: tRNA (adenosine(37)-N6)-dimethylallyltransferase MiaA [Flavobacteriaceae bacterium]
MTKKTLITLSGPTASGKTALAIRLANLVDAEIFSCDSRQFYKEMSIGTAVPNKEELSLAPHHFIQHLSIEEPYSVGKYEQDAIEALTKYFSQKDTAILVGGSGLYMQAVTEGLDVFPDVSEAIRTELGNRLNTLGLANLQEELQQLDPTYYQQVDVNNPSRVMRALGVCLSSGQAYSSFLGKPKPERPFEVLPLTVEIDRNVLYIRINQRVDNMMSAGLLQEAHALYPHRALNALQTVGYKELFDFFDEKIDLEKAVADIKQHTRNFAKRQLTWVRRKEKTAQKIDTNISDTALEKLIKTWHNH